MLEAMRGYANSWIIKGFLVLLIVSFAVWGIGDVFRGGSTSTTLATVGGQEVQAEEVRRLADESFRRLQQQFGGSLERSPGIMEGMIRKALERTVAQKLVDEHAAKLGLTVDPTTLASLVREEPGFQENGSFDRNRFDYMLRQLGRSEAGYMADLKGEILRQQMVQAVSGSVAAPEPIVRQLARFRSEQREGRTLIVEAKAMIVEEPDAATMQSWLEENQARFTAPEYRKVDLLAIRPSDLLAEIEIDRDRLEAAYDQRRDAYTTPEQRTAEQLLAADRAVLDEAKALIAAGESLATVAERLKDKGVVHDSVGPLGKGTLPPALDTALFAAAADSVSDPVESPFGWHLFKVTRIDPQIVQPLPAVEQALRTELAEQEAVTLLDKVANQIDDAIAGGASLADTAREAGAHHYALAAIDSTGRDPDGKKLEEQVVTAEMLERMFDTPQGTTSAMVHGQQDSYFVVHVASVQPPRPRRLDEVEAAVKDAILAERRGKAAKALAEELQGLAKGGQDLETMIRAGVRLQAIPPTKRGEAAGALGPDVTRVLFETAPGQLAAAPVVAGEDFAIVATTAILPLAADLPTVPVAQALRSELQTEMLTAYEQALRRSLEVVPDQQAIAALIQSVSQ